MCEGETYRQLSDMEYEADRIRRTVPKNPSYIHRWLITQPGCGTVYSVKIYKDGPSLTFTPSEGRGNLKDFRPGPFEIELVFPKKTSIDTDPSAEEVSSG